MDTYHTLPVPERISLLRDDLFARQTSFCFERARIVTDSYQKTEGEPSALRRAKALHAVFTKIPIFIREGELIVGQRASVLAGRSVYPEFNLQGLQRETTPSDIWDYWCHTNIAAKVRAAQPERLVLAEHERAAGYCTGASSGFGHVVVDYGKVLTRGFHSIIAEAKEHLEQSPEHDTEGRAFLHAVCLASEGLITWANRYAEVAEALAATTTDARRTEELMDIAATCRHVPAYPARTFAEALQSFWFVHLAMHIEQYGWSISAGRFDQYMFPFYQKSIGNGDLTRESAWELLLNLWVKFMENVGTQLKATTFQNLTLGGQDNDGYDQSNELSRLCIHATVALGFNQPALSVRWHPNIDPDFWQHAHHAIGVGLGMPALFNDSVIIPALIAHGVSQEDAFDYGIVGCVEASVPGRQQGLTAGGHINVAKALELALNDGRSMITGEQIGLPTGNPEEFDSFDDLWDAYVTQVQYLAGLNLLATHIAGEVQKGSGHCPLMSALLSDCLANRRDLVFGGTRYNLPGIAIYGPSNVYDALMAIRCLVYEQQRVCWSDLLQALRDDFEGHEPLRQMLAHTAPRFGNDIEEVDEFANQVNAVHADFCWHHVDSRNGRYTCGVWPVNAHVDVGRWTAATPDGRHKGTTLVDGVGACHGADTNGPTALLKSVARLNHIEHWPAGNTCNIKFAQTSLQNERAIDKLQSLTETFMRLGGQELQINVLDAATLRDAQTSPDQYHDLIVRVAGYSAYFTQLGTDIQNEIIQRTEHTL